jgi:hypothetical protein
VEYRVSNEYNDLECHNTIISQNTTNWYKAAIALVATVAELDELAESQALITGVNAEQAAIAASVAVLVAVNDDIAGNLVGTFITAAELNSIIGVTGAVSAVDYSAPLVADIYSDNVNPTAAEIQTVITATNAVVAEDTQKSVLLKATDAQGDTLNYVIITEPSNGTLTFSNSDDGLWLYQGNADYHGTDSFSYQASDGAKISNTATVNIVVEPVNDSSVAAEDVLTLTFNNDGSYLIDPLANDSDIDDDSLTITAASSTIGDVSIDDGQLVYQLSGALQEVIEMNYTIDDGSGANNSAAQEVIRLTIDSSANDQLPIVISVSDVQYQANELLTKIALASPSALDGNNNAVSVTLVDPVSRFSPGNHLVYWQAENAAGVMTITPQQVAVFPLISLGQVKMKWLSKAKSLMLIALIPTATNVQVRAPPY